MLIWLANAVLRIRLSRTLLFRSIVAAAARLYEPMEEPPYDSTIEAGWV